MEHGTWNYKKARLLVAVADVPFVRPFALARSCSLCSFSSAHEVGRLRGLRC